MSTLRYEQYKDSKVEWLGQVPSHWRVDRLKASIQTCRNGIWGEEALGDENDIPCVRVSDFDRRRLRVELSEPTVRNVTENERVSRVLCKGDLLLEKSGGGEKQPVGCVVLYDDARPAVCSNFVARIVAATGQDSSYWRYVHAAAYAVRLTVGSINQTSGLQNLDQDRYFNEYAAFPPQAEQTAIATFLDHEIAKIDALVEEQKRLIELLKEKRQAVISQAVTKGLNPTVPMKDSGVEWLGEVPAHWAISRLKFVAHVQTGVAKGKDNAGKMTVEVPYLRVANVQDGFLDLDEISTIEIPFDDLARYSLRAGDVLMNEGGDFDKLGRGHVWDGSIEPCIHQNHVFAVRPWGVSPQWLNVVTSSDYAQFYFMSRSKQSTNLASISSTNLMELPVVIPPCVEQGEVLNAIDAQCATCERMIEDAIKAIKLLLERRSALISAAVTGKIDVREAA